MWREETQLRREESRSALLPDRMEVSSLRRFGLSQFYQSCDASHVQLEAQFQQFIFGMCHIARTHLYDAAI
jgi:hypothetical protein